MFLSLRDTRNPSHNATASVFLRILEYFNGILIMTTNRVGDFDEAFISRIHLILEYPPLDESSTLEVWNNYIRRIRNDRRYQISDQDVRQILKYAKEQYHSASKWNGRQIRNAFQTALALARFDAQKEFDEEVKSGERSADSKMGRIRVVMTHFVVIGEESRKYTEYINKLRATKKGNNAYEDMARQNLIRNA